MTDSRVGGGNSPGDITAQPAPSNTERLAAYADRSLAWTHGQQTEDELLQRIWNLAGDVKKLAAELAAARAEAEQAKERVRYVEGQWSLESKWRQEADARDIASKNEAERLREDTVSVSWDDGDDQ